MYCDFCGKKITYNAKYCRSCGQSLRSSIEDTQPLPAVSQTMLQSSVERRHISWYRTIFPRKPLTKRNGIWRILYDLSALVFISILLYILVSFKTIWDYQVLTTLWGGGVLIYMWWRR